jgi:hypothetical protein
MSHSVRQTGEQVVAVVSASDEASANAETVTAASYHSEHPSLDGSETAIKPFVKCALGKKLVGKLAEPAVDLCNAKKGDATNAESSDDAYDRRHQGFSK